MEGFDALWSSVEELLMGTRVVESLIHDSELQIQLNQE